MVWLSHDKKIAPEIELAVGRAEFLRVLHGMLGIASATEQPVLRGVLFEITRTALRMVATDGRRLLIGEIQSSGGGEGSLHFFLPLETAAQLKEKVPSEGDDFSMIIKDQKVHLNSAAYPFQDAEKYPPYGNVLPKSSPVALRLDGALFHFKLKQLGLVENAKESFVVFELSDGVLRMRSSGTKAFEEMPVPYKGKKIAVGANRIFLESTLERIVCGGGELIFELAGPGKPLIFRRQKMIYVVMPVEVS